jgi:hypothetical protein
MRANSATWVVRIDQVKEVLEVYDFAASALDAANYLDRPHYKDRVDSLRVDAPVK